MLYIVKKDGTKEQFNGNKIINAITKSAERLDIKFTKEEEKEIVTKAYILASLFGQDIPVFSMHNIVERTLDEFNKDVAKSYRDYRNYKNDGYSLLIDVERQIYSLLNEVDRENSNTNPRLISTQRTMINQKLAKELYQKNFLSVAEREAVKQGYIYIHDMVDRLLGMLNCCLFDAKKVLEDGFFMEGQFYTEPKDIDTAIGQLGDLIMSASAQQYGGFTVPHIDKTLAKYFEMTYLKKVNEITEDTIEQGHKPNEKIIKVKAYKRAYRELKQAMQGLEIKLNTVVSARGSFPFTTLTVGDVENEYEAAIAKAVFEVRIEGHGKPGKKQSQIFPKIVFLHDDKIHSEGMKYEWLFDLAILCSSKCMYPDYIDADSYKRYGKWVHPMGCRAYLSDYFDENGEIQYIGRFNIGAISSHLPMIYMKAKEENKDFFEVLDFYLEMARNIHKKTYDYMGKMSAYTNPLMFCEGGAYGGNLKPEDKITDILKSATASFGITALNELTQLELGKSIAEDNSFAMKVMKHINEKVENFKKEDDNLYAIYGTPAESLCGTQIKQFRAKYGVIENVSDREYFTNSFHCHVSEDITPFEKQDLEAELFHMHKGGHIQYVRISNPSNLKGLKALILRGLKKGFYQGVNFNACTCNNCGNKGDSFGDTCPKCGSSDITEFNRICGYMGFSKKNGDYTMNDAKMSELPDRRSM